MLSLLFFLRCTTLEGETDEATCASDDSRADLTAGGIPEPAGKTRPSADATWIVNKPDWICDPFGLPGVGVVDRGALSSAERLALDAFGDFLPNFHDMLVRERETSLRDSARGLLTTEELMINEEKRATVVSERRGGQTVVSNYYFRPLNRLSAEKSRTRTWRSA